MNGDMARIGDRVRYDGASEQYIGKDGRIIEIVAGVNHEQVRGIVIDIEGKQFATYADCLIYLGPEVPSNAK